MDSRVRPVSRSATVICTMLAAIASVALSAAPEADVSGAFGHLKTRDDGPAWTYDTILAAVGSGPSLRIEPGKPVPRIADAAAAVRAALERLKGTDAGGYDVAFRLAGAAATQTKDANAIRLLARLQHDGIGTRVDASGALRTALDLVRAGDGEGCAFVAQGAPKSLWAAAKSVASLKRLRAMPGPATVKLSMPITTGKSKEVTVGGGSGDGDPLPLHIATTIEEMKDGRIVNLAGVWADGEFTAYAGEVPKPDANFEWQLVKQPVHGGSWQLQTVKVSVRNTGQQMIKSLKFKVRCTINGGRMNDHTQIAEARDIAPGKTVNVDVGFEMYNYQYLDAVASPKVTVTPDGYEW